MEQKTIKLNFIDSGWDRIDWTQLVGQDGQPILLRTDEGDFALTEVNTNFVTDVGADTVLVFKGPVDTHVSTK